MVVEYTKEELLFLGEYNEWEVNARVLELYKSLDGLAKEQYNNPAPLYKPVIQHALHKFKKMKGSSSFSKEDFVLMELASCILYSKTQLDRFYGKEGWKNFNSPTEVLASSIPVFSLCWNHRMVEFNVKETYSNKCYEVDQLWRDHFNNVVFLVDVQGKLPHQNKKQFDDKKFKDLNEHTTFIQINGTTLVNNYAGACHLIIKRLKEAYSCANISYINPLANKKAQQIRK